MGKRFTANCVVIFALFFEISMPKIHNLLKNYEVLPNLETLLRLCLVHCLIRQSLQKKSLLDCSVQTSHKQLTYTAFVFV